MGVAVNSPTVQFYLEGIHCTACLWLLEKLPELLPNEIATARLDLQKSVITLKFTESGSISRAAEYIDQLGYRPHPIFSSQEGEALELKASRLFLCRTAVAGALAGNIMIFSVAIYTGATGYLKDHFDLITLFLAIPVFTFSAVPIYQNAWNAVANKRW